MKNWLTKTAIKFEQFMVGRYGIDAFYKALLVFYLILIILNSILLRITTVGYYITLVLSLAVLVFAFYRVFSKNISARRKENNWWLKTTAPIVKQSKLLSDKWKFRKTHVFRKCPNCKAVLRLPKKKGKHNVNCPHCRQNFKVTVR